MAGAEERSKNTPPVSRDLGTAAMGRARRLFAEPKLLREPIKAEAAAPVQPSRAEARGCQLKAAVT